MKTINSSLVGISMTFYYRHLQWTAEDFRVGEEVVVVIDGTSYLGTVRAIASYGVDVLIDKERA